MAFTRRTEDVFFSKFTPYKGGMLFFIELLDAKAINTSECLTFNNMISTKIV